MNENTPNNLPPGLTFGDILYTLFRRKWLIVSISLASLVAAFVVWKRAEKIYESEAKLLIKYVVQANPPAGRTDARVQEVDDRGENILSTELQILTSRDLALRVADAVGPGKILARIGGGNDRERAADAINNPKNLLTEVPKKSNVIRIAFRHPDPEVVQPVL